MHLTRLELVNFRQHAKSEIRFGDGLTGIIGPNGAGKSTILEAIAWAIYGSPAVRGTNDTLRFSRAPHGSKVLVELVFELAGRRYRVVRTLTTARVWLDGGDEPVVTGIRDASDWLEERLSLSRDEFFNTYFTGQKELDFLAQMGSAERGRFLSQVLGYDRLREAQERARTRRNELRHETRGLEAGLPDPEELEREREQTEERRTQAAEALEAAERTHERAEKRRSELEPRWQEAREHREKAREWGHALEVARREHESAERERGRAAGELKQIAEAEDELEELRERLAPLSDTIQECERLAEAARLDERRRALEETEQSLEQELADGHRRLERLVEAPERVERYGGEVDELKREAEEVEEKREGLRSDWVEKREEARAKLDNYRERAAELDGQLDQLREAGADGACPTCGRSLDGEYERVIERLEDEWEELVQDGKWFKRRREQLSSKPEELAEAESRRRRLETRLERKTRRLARCEQAASELAGLRAEREKKRARLERLREQLDELPTGYDAERHEEAEQRLERLRELESRANRLEQVVEPRPARERERDEAGQRIERAAERIAELEGELAALGFREEELAELEAEYEEAAERVRTAELEATEARGRVETAKQALERAERAETDYRERQSELEGLEEELRYHNELDAAFSQLRTELNARVRPELGELASTFLADITDGRYTALEIDDDYNVLVLEEGEEKPVISGGEEDIANLVLRLAISQMIAERAGHPLTTLILDEVFGSLDLERRDNVVELLHRLGDRFEQVILITHVETIREGLDQVIGVEFDERTGASVVR